MQATFPHLCYQQDARFYPVGMSLDPQESISGTQTIIPTMRARWMAQVGFALKGEAAQLQWRAFLLQMQGRLGTTLVPVFSRWGVKDRDGHGLPFCDVASLVDAQTWEHFGFENTQVTRAVVKTAAPLRATVLDLTLYDTTGLRPGQYFSIGDRLHAVRAHWQPDSATHRVAIVPPLRAAVPAGAHVEIEKPVCRMRMVTESEGLFDQAMDVFPSVSVQFQEAI